MWLHMKKKISLLLTLLLICGMTLQAAAAERSVGALTDCGIGVSAASNGVRITCSTNSTLSADEIGVKDVVLQEKVNGSWRNINISGGMERNSSSYNGSIVYTGAVRGRTYRAYCTHYAKYGNTTKTLNNNSGELMFN